MSPSTEDLEEFKNSILTGVTVGMGSLILQFSSNAYIMMQCDFRVSTEFSIKSGHAEKVDYSPILFQLLNEQVESIEFTSQSTLSLTFSGAKHLEIIPDNSGLEAYTITCRHGIIPVAL